MKNQSKVVVVVGPTASGKSDLAIKLSRKLNGEIISADSRQVYRGLDLGTGKVTKREQKVVKHYLIDVASPRRQFTADDFVRLGREAIKRIVSRGKLPIIVGGTGFYIDALLGRINLVNVPPDKKLRAKLEKHSAEQLFAMLKKVDPRRAAQVDPKNKRRLARALEIVIKTGKPVPKNRTASDYKVLWLGIKIPKEELEMRILTRLKSRFKQGMVAEARRLLNSGVSHKRLYDLGLEYRWISMYLKGEISKEELQDGLYKAILQYSKRQMTWFKRNQEIKWFSQKQTNYLARYLESS